MCKECGFGRCDSRCPNAPEAQTFGECYNCGAEIEDGEDYYDIEGNHWCTECISDARKTAEVDYDDF